MPNEPELSFEELVGYRRQLQRFCSAHYASLLSFLNGISFKLSLGDRPLGGKARHLSSTATCIESLLDWPVHCLPKRPIDI